MENKNIQPSFETLIGALDWLKLMGFTHDFNLKEDCIKCTDAEHSLSPSEFAIEYVFRFEGETDPGDESIIYGISSQSRNIKGVLVSAFGVYADSLSQEMVSKLAVH